MGAVDGQKKCVLYYIKSGNNANVICECSLSAFVYGSKSLHAFQSVPCLTKPYNQTSPNVLDFDQGSVVLNSSNE